jgi:hypothetical protein
VSEGAVKRVSLLSLLSLLEKKEGFTFRPDWIHIK